MASEALSIPEEHLGEVIDIIRAGLKSKKHVTPEVRDALTTWCEEESEYAHRLKGAKSKRRR